MANEQRDTNVTQNTTTVDYPHPQLTWDSPIYRGGIDQTVVNGVTIYTMSEKTYERQLSYQRETGIAVGREQMLDEQWGAVEFVGGWFLYSALLVGLAVMITTAQVQKLIPAKRGK